jgi:hypothetical protein
MVMLAHVLLAVLIISISPTRAADMSKYVGKYPWENIDGQSFFDAIQKDFVATFGKARWKVFSSYKTSPPMKHQANAVLGDLLDVSICMPYNCNTADARILLEENSGRIIQLCFEKYARFHGPGADDTLVSHDVEWMGITMSNSRWFFHFMTPGQKKDEVDDKTSHVRKNASISCGDGWEKIMRDLASAE